MKSAVRNNAFTKTDLAAGVIGLVLVAFFLLTARYGVGVHDESYYLTVPQRLLMGDRMFIDEWHLTQLGQLLHFIPYFVYTRVTDGTQGLILFFRYFYILVNAVFYCWMYVMLRRWKGCGLFAAASFCILLYGAFTGFNYHSYAGMAIMIFCLLVFFSEPFPFGGKLVFSGLVLACGVLAQPFLIFAFGVYFAAVLLRNTVFKAKKLQEPIGSFLNVRTFLLITAGAFCAFLFTVMLLVRNGAFGGLSDVLPYLFSGKEYNLSEFLSFSALRDAVSRFGAVPVAGLLLCAVAAAVYRFRKKKTPAVRLSVLVCLSVFLIASFASSVYGIAAVEFTDNIYHVLIYHDFPFLLASLSVCLLCDRPDPRCVLLWIVGFLFSLCVDASSYTLLASGGKITLVAGLLSVRTLSDEFHAERSAAKKKKKRSAERLRRVATVAAAVALAFTGVWNLGYACAGGLFEPFEFVAAGYRPWSCTQTLEEGPFAGLRTSNEIAALYNGSLNDLDAVRTRAGDRSVLVFGCLPWMYLYLNAPYAAYTSYYLDEPERLLEYWQVLPERRPAVIYAPYYDYNYENPRYRQEETIAGITDHISSFTTEPGESGYIITVTGDFVF